MMNNDFLIGFGAGKAAGAGSSVSVIPLSASENSVYTAPSGKAYSPVTVNVAFPPAVEIEPLTVNSDGVYTAPSGKAYSPVTVSVGGGGGGDEDGIISRKISVITNNTVSVIGTYAFYECQFLSEASFGAVEKIGIGAFSGATALKSLSFPACTEIGTSAFMQCTQLKNAFFPECKKIDGNAFQSCRSLAAASFPKCSFIGNYAFRSCYSLVSLYLMSESVVTLNGNDVFASSPIGGYSTSAHQYGSVFVPMSLLSAYQSANRWSAISARIVGVE